MREPRSAARTGRAAPDHALDGAALITAFAGGAEALRQHADALNAINVFPVPDGDTGTNMSMTMRACIDEIARAEPGAGAAAILAAAARGALMGAKGNSGVILSQILEGMAAGAAGDRIDGAALAAGFARGRAAAYRLISKPREGTILTAISEAAETAAAASGDGALDVVAAAAAGAAAATARTPELLPVLKEAGVVDAGAQGLAVLLDGMARALRGEAQAAGADYGAIDPAWLGATRRLHERDGARAGFCTEFVVEGDALDAEAVRAHLQRLGDSVLVVGGGRMLRVHVHTHAPQDAIAWARTLGTVSHEKVDDMEAQFRALSSRSAAAPAGPRTGLAVVAVGAGDGIEALFASMGATVVRGGQTMNPSIGDIRAAIDATGAADVIVLPNNRNIVLAARQAAIDAPARVHVVETVSIPQGVAALVALNAESSFDENVAAMDAAASPSAVRTAEVTLAARATSVHGLRVREGQPIGLIDGELAVAEESVEAAVRACVARIAADGGCALVTLYAGAGVRRPSADALAAALAAEFGAEVEVVEGGQPHYPYLVGVE